MPSVPRRSELAGRSTRGAHVEHGRADHDDAHAALSAARSLSHGPPAAAPRRRAPRRTRSSRARGTSRLPRAPPDSTSPNTCTAAVSVRRGMLPAATTTEPNSPRARNRVDEGPPELGEDLRQPLPRERGDGQRHHEQEVGRRRPTQAELAERPSSRPRSARRPRPGQLYRRARASVRMPAVELVRNDDMKVASERCDNGRGAHGSGGCVGRSESPVFLPTACKSTRDLPRIRGGGLQGCGASAILVTTSNVIGAMRGNPHDISHLPIALAQAEGHVDPTSGVRARRSTA